MNSGYTVGLTLTRLIASLTSVLCLSHASTGLVKQTILNDKTSGIAKLYVVSMLVCILLYLVITLFLIRDKSTYDENVIAQKLLRHACRLIFVVTTVLAVMLLMLDMVESNILLVLMISSVAWLISRVAHGLIVTLLQESISERHDSSYKNFSYTILREERVETLTQPFDYQDGVKQLPQSETYVSALVKLRFALMPMTIKANVTLPNYSVPKRAK